jgi:hypothetical protein
MTRCRLTPNISDQAPEAIVWTARWGRESLVSCISSARFCLRLAAVGSRRLRDFLGRGIVEPRSRSKIEPLSQTPRLGRLRRPRCASRRRPRSSIARRKLPGPRRAPENILTFQRATPGLELADCGVTRKVGSMESLPSGGRRRRKHVRAPRSTAARRQSRAGALPHCQTGPTLAVSALASC